MEEPQATAVQGVRDWCTSHEYTSSLLDIKATKFLEVTDVLLERPNLNSTHLFRADILSDTKGILRTVGEKEDSFLGSKNTTPSRSHSPSSSSTSGNSSSASSSHQSTEDVNANWTAPKIPGFDLQRTVIRRLIPRKAQFDRPKEQSCFCYISSEKQVRDHASLLIVYVPHVANETEIPWYHPKVQALAYQFTSCIDGATVSVHYRLFPTQDKNNVPDRLHRTMISLLRTFVRLVKIESPKTKTDAVSQTATGTVRPSARALSPAALKDTILPQHIVQDTYTRLKEKYAPDLIVRWVEKTDPAKHLFEDLGIAAFLIELWKSMYGGEKAKENFPGFVDMGCGNGVLLYILIKEGFKGRGFDARQRKTWEILTDIDHDLLKAQICIPRILLDMFWDDELEDIKESFDGKIHDGIFAPGEFIISNHADELTLWTPFFAAMACIERYNPFFIIPCCSHGLSGARHRYYYKDIDNGYQAPRSEYDEFNPASLENFSPGKGDLRFLRMHKGNVDESTYGCLTKKAVAIAEDLGFDTELTLVRIPSTRNIGIVGNRHLRLTADPERARTRISQVSQWECRPFNGLRCAAVAWVDRARRHTIGPGRGKLNLGGPMDSAVDLDHVPEDNEPDQW